MLCKKRNWEVEQINNGAKLINGQRDEASIKVFLNRVSADAAILHSFQPGFVFRLFLHYFLSLKVENFFDRNKFESDTFSLRRKSNKGEGGG